MSGAPQGFAVRGEPVEVPAGRVRLPGLLAIPEQPAGIVVFAHGSGSSRASPRNLHVAALLHRARLATLLFDLLTDAEAVDRRNVFDVPLLAGRLGCARDWVASEPAVSGLPLGYFGASTGAAAALWAAAGDPAVRAVVSRGGRPDLAAERLAEVAVPTLLIVGELDPLVLELNREALALLGGLRELRVVPGATHLFEEPGTLAAAATLARGWFAAHLGG